MKRITGLLFLSLFMFGCTDTASNNLNPDNYAETVAFVSEHFDTENVPQISYVPDYVKGLDRHDLSKGVSIFVNKGSEVAYMQFEGITSEKAKLILENVGGSKTNPINYLIDDPDSYEKEEGQRYILFSPTDEIGIHVLALKEEEAEKLGRDGIYTLNIFYNKTLYEKFVSS